jgi:hypothetical protein
MKTSSVPPFANLPARVTAATVPPPPSAVCNSVCSQMRRATSTTPRHCDPFRVVEAAWSQRREGEAGKAEMEAPVASGTSLHGGRSFASKDTRATLAVGHIAYKFKEN